MVVGHGERVGATLSREGTGGAVAAANEPCQADRRPDQALVALQWRDGRDGTHWGHRRDRVSAQATVGAISSVGRVLEIGIAIGIVIAVFSIEDAIAIVVIVGGIHQAIGIGIPFAIAAIDDVIAVHVAIFAITEAIGVHVAILRIE